MDSSSIMGGSSIMGSSSMDSSSIMGGSSIDSSSIMGGSSMGSSSMNTSSMGSSSMGSSLKSTYNVIASNQLDNNYNAPAPVINAASKKLRYYNQDSIKDPYAQISNSGFTPVGNLKTYGVANMYDRSEPTKLRDLPELYTVPYTTTPFLGTNTTSIKYIDDDSTKLRYPVFQNKKSAIDITQIDFYPEQAFVENPGVSQSLNNFYQQATTINLVKENEELEAPLDPNKIMMGQSNFGLNTKRFVNRWNIVDPRVVQNVDNIVMNMKDSNGNKIGLFQCGISTRNELRNYVEVNNC